MRIPWNLLPALLLLASPAFSYGEDLVSPMNQNSTFTVTAGKTNIVVRRTLQYLRGQHVVLSYQGLHLPMSSGLSADLVFHCQSDLKRIEESLREIHPSGEHRNFGCQPTVSADGKIMEGVFAQIDILDEAEREALAKAFWPSCQSSVEQLNRISSLADEKTIYDPGEYCLGRSSEPQDLP